MNITDKLKSLLDNCYETKRLYPGNTDEQVRVIKILFDELVLHVDWLRYRKNLLLIVRDKLLEFKYEKNISDFDEYYRIIFDDRI